MNPDPNSRVVRVDSDDVLIPMTPVVASDPRYVQQIPTAGPRIDAIATAVPADVVVHEVPVAHQTVVAEPVRRISYTRRFAPDAVIAAVVGLVLLLIGLLAITRGGFDDPMSLPVVSVLGFTHTTTLGLIEIVIGGCLLICGATSSRSGAIFFGSVLGIAGFVGAAQTESFRENLALESGLAWLCVLGAVLVVGSALLMPRFITRTNRVQRL